MENQHTKGPWCINTTKKYLNDCKGLAITDQNDKLICEVTLPSTNKGQDEFEANAYLIHSAPEMYEFLNKVINASEERGVKGCTYGDTDYDSLSAAYGYNLCLEHFKAMARPALKKANGE